MLGKCIGNNLIKLGFGKSKPTRVLWLDGVSEHLKDTYLLDYFKSYCENNVHQALIDRVKCQALVYFGTIEDAKMCADKIRAKRFYDRRIMVDFASKEFISSRFEHLLDPKHHLLGNQRSSSTAMSGSDRKLSSRNIPSSWSSRQRSITPSNRSPSQRSGTNSLNNEVRCYQSHHFFVCSFMLFNFSKIFFYRKIYFYKLTLLTLFFRFSFCQKR